MAHDDGWEWPVLLLILASFPDDMFGERAAVQEWTDLFIAHRSGRLDDVDRLRRRYLQGDT